MPTIKVSLIKTQDPYEGVAKALDALKPYDISIRGSRVLLKPNLCSPVPPAHGPSVTHPEVVGALIRYLKEAGAQRVLVGDEPVWGMQADLCYRASGVAQVVAREGGEMIDFDAHPRVEIKVPGGRVYDKVSLPAVFTEVDLIVNAPKMKTSLMTLVTLCLKNLFGLIPFIDRKKYHRGIDLAYALVDIAKVVTPGLNLIDGIVAMEGMGAHSGTPVDLGALIASTNMVAADFVATQVMGFDPLEPVTTQLALKDGLGFENQDQLEIVGQTVAEMQHPFKRPVFRLVHPAPNVEVMPGGICPGCHSRIPKIPPQVDQNRRYGVIIGKRVHLPRELEFDEIWCFGDCGVEEARRLAKKHPELEKKLIKVPGCPPLDWWRKQTLDKELAERGREEGRHDELEH